MPKPNQPDTRSHKSGVSDGYEQCAAYLDAMAQVWKNGSTDGHGVAAMAITSAAECLRKLRKTL